MADIRHQDLAGDDAIHPSRYIQETDPGAVGAYKEWYKPSTRQHFYRSSTNTEWVEITPGGDSFTVYDPDKPPATASALDDECSTAGTGPDAKWTAGPWTPTADDVSTTVEGAYYSTWPTGSAIQALFQAIPTGDFTVVLDAESRLMPGEAFGVVLSSANTMTSGTQTGIAINNTSGTVRWGGYDYNAGSFSSNNFTEIPDRENGRVQIRIRRSGSTYYAAWRNSAVGGPLEYINERSFTPNGTPAYVGIYYYNVTTTGGTLIVHSFRYSPSATATFGGMRTIGASPVAGEAFSYLDPEKAPLTPSALDDEFNGSSLDAKWTTVQSSVFTSTTITDGALVCTIASGASDDIGAFVQALPAGDFTVFTHVTLPYDTTIYHYAGLILADGTTVGSGSQVGVSLIHDSGPIPGVWMHTHTGYQTFNTDPLRGIRFYDAAYLRLRRSGSSYYFGYSVDGRSWDERPITVSITPTHIGLYGANNHATIGAVATFRFFRYVASATAVLGEVREVGPSVTHAPSACVTLTDGATITWDTVGRALSNAKVTLGGDRTLVLGNLASGASGHLIVQQDPTGGRTLTLPGLEENEGLVLSTAPNAIDILSFLYDGTTIYWAAGKRFG